MHHHTKQARYNSTEKWTKTIKGTRNKKTGIWEVTLETQQSEDFANKILDQASKPELVQYLHAELFSPSTASLLKEIKQGFPKTWPGITEKLIKKHLEKKVPQQQDT